MCEVENFLTDPHIYNIKFLCLFEKIILGKNGAFLFDDENNIAPGKRVKDAFWLSQQKMFKSLCYIANLWQPVNVGFENRMQLFQDKQGTAKMQHELRRKIVWASGKYIMPEVFEPRIQASHLGHQPGTVGLGLRTCPVSTSHQRSKKKQCSEYMYRNVVSIISARLSLFLSLTTILTFRSK